MDPARSEVSLTRIHPTRGWIKVDLRELWAYRELAFFLTWRDLAVRYKQTLLGVLWALLQPLLLMVVFTAIFSVVAKVQTGGVPYAVFVFAGLLPWQLFSHALTQASISIVGSEQLITKVYFPRLLIPTASILAGVADLVVGLGLLGVLMIVFGVAPSPSLLLLPVFAGLTIVTALGAGLWLAALNVEYRDVRFTLPFLTQLWMFATPIVYPSSILPEALRPVAWLNPMAGVVEGFRWAVVGGHAPEIQELATSCVIATLLLVGGALYFRRMERTFADVI